MEIRTNADGTYDLWDGDTHLLERTTLLHIAHFEMHGHENCGPDCPNRPRNTDCDFQQDRDAAGYLTHAECACPTDLVEAYRRSGKK